MVQTGRFIQGHAPNMQRITEALSDNQAFIRLSYFLVKAESYVLNLLQTLTLPKHWPTSLTSHYRSITNCVSLKEMDCKGSQNSTSLNPNGSNRWSTSRCHADVSVDGEVTVRGGGVAIYHEPHGAPFIIDVVWGLMPRQHSRNNRVTSSCPYTIRFTAHWEIWR